MSRMEDKVKRVLHCDSNKERKINKHGCNAQDPWDAIRRPNLGICRMQDEAEVEN